ncbi:MAG: 30S ribosomal protein S16 [Candidatus Limnocylindria bacterium]
MAVRIRLTRVGATKRPSYRVIAIDKRRARDGRALEILGFYDPLTEPATVRLETDKIKAWIGNGAQPSETVVKLMRIAESGDQRTAPKASAKPKARKAKAEKEAAAAVDAAPTPEVAETAPADEPLDAADAAATPAEGEPESADGAASAPEADEAARAEKAEA